MRISGEVVETARTDREVADALYREVEDVRKKVRNRMSGFLWLYRDVIEEALDQAFLKTLSVYDSRLGDFRQLYYRIAFNESLQACRTERKQLERLICLEDLHACSEPGSERDDSLPCMAAEAIQDLEQRCRRRYLKEMGESELVMFLEQVLSHSERMLISLCLEGYTHNEIRRRFGWSRRTLEQQLCVVREKLSLLIDPDR